MSLERQPTLTSQLTREATSISESMTRVRPYYRSAERQPKHRLRPNQTSGPSIGEFMRVNEVTPHGEGVSLTPKSGPALLGVS